MSSGPAVVATLALSLASLPSLAQSVDRRFVPVGQRSEAPRGFMDMCLRDATLCGARTSADAGDANVVTGAVIGPGPRVAPARATKAVATDERRLLDRINHMVNSRVRQRTDEALFGLGELWRRSGVGRDAAGDCEDLAIEKRLQLQAAGFPADRLSYAVGYSPRAGLHTVLLARTAEGDMVLDSRSRAIERWDKAPYRWLTIQSPDDPLAWHVPAA